MRASVFSRTRQTSPSSQGGSILIHSWTLGMFGNGAAARTSDAWLRNSRRADCGRSGIASGSQSVRSAYWTKDCVWYRSRSLGPAAKTLRRPTGMPELEPGVSSAEVQAESQREQLQHCNCPLRKRANVPVASNCRRICPGSNRSSPVQPINASVAAVANRPRSLATRLLNNLMSSGPNTSRGWSNARSEPVKGSKCTPASPDYR
jgi:hypothetical protein